jgi:type III restriction enzyme
MRQDHENMHARVAEEVANLYRPSRLEFKGTREGLDIAAIVVRTTGRMIQQAVDIPRILIVPTGKVQSGFKTSTLKLEVLNYPAVLEELWAKHLRTDQVDVIEMGKGTIHEEHLEDCVVGGLAGWLVDFSSIPL